MELWRRNFVVLWVGIFCTASSYTMITPFLPLYIKELGVSDSVEVWAGVIIAANFFSQAVMAPIWGSLADRYGRKAMVLRSALVIAIVYVLMALVTNLWQLLALRLINGIFSGFNSAAAALISTNTPEDKVGRMLGLLQTGAASGHLMGPLLGGLLADIFGIRTSLWLGGGLMFTATGLVAVFVQETVRTGGKKRSTLASDLQTAFRTPVLLPLMVTTVITQAAVNALQPVLPLHIADLTGHTASGSMNGFIFSLLGVATIIAAPIWARRGEKVGFEANLRLGLAVAGAIVTLQVFTGNPWLFALVHFCYGLALTACTTSVHAVIATRIDLNFRGRAFGINQSATLVGNSLGPILGGLMGGLLSPRWVFAYTGVLLLLNSLWVRRRLPGAGAPAAAAAG